MCLSLSAMKNSKLYVFISILVLLLLFTILALFNGCVLIQGQETIKETSAGEETAKETLTAEETSSETTIVESSTKKQSIPRKTLILAMEIILMAINLHKSMQLLQAALLMTASITNGF